MDHLFMHCGFTPFTEFLFGPTYGVGGFSLGTLDLYPQVGS